MPKKKSKSRLYKKASKYKSRIPRWAIFVVIGVVFALGVFWLFTTFAAGLLDPNTVRLVSSGGRGKDASQPASERSPITIEACRMSDTPGDGPANRVYFGAKPVYSKEAADKLNSVWDRHFPEYHIDGQDVPWAVDHYRPGGIYYNARYVVDAEKPTDTRDAYNPYYKPSESRAAVASGKYNSMGNYNSRQRSFGVDGNGPPVIKRDYVDATIYGRQANLWEKDYSAQGARNGATSPWGIIDKNNPNQSNDYPIYFGKMPGRTAWSYLSGPVATMNKSKCDATPAGKAGYGCAGNPDAYDVINNPNPFIVVDVAWASSVYTVDNQPKKQYDIESFSNVVRFKDLPKCGRAPATYTRSLTDRNAEAAKYNRLAEQFKKNAEAAKIAAGVTQDSDGKLKMEMINFENGITTQIYGGLPPGSTTN